MSNTTNSVTWAELKASIDGVTSWLKLKEAIDKQIETLGLHPLMLYMKAKGFDPAKGGRLVLPEKYREIFPPFGAPYFVHFSSMLTDNTTALLFRDPFAATPFVISGLKDITESTA